MAFAFGQQNDGVWQHLRGECNVRKCNPDDCGSTGIVKSQMGKVHMQDQSFTCSNTEAQNIAHSYGSRISYRKVNMQKKKSTSFEIEAP